MLSLKMASTLSKLLEPSFLGYLLFAIFIMVGLVLNLWRRRDFLAYLLMTLFLICFILISLDYIKPFLPIHGDSLRTYIPKATEHADSWRKSIIESIATFNIKDVITSGGGNVAYVYPLGLVFYLTGNSLQAARLFSTIFGMMLIYMLYQLTERLYDTRTAKFTALLLGCAPYYWLLSVSILRDVHAVFFLLWFLKLWIQYQTETTNKIKFLMIFSFLYLGMLRPPVLLVMLCVIILYKTALNFEKPSLLIFRIMKLGLAALVLTYTCNAVSNDQSLGDIRITKGVQYADFDNMAARNQGSSDSDSGYAGEFHYSNYYEAMMYLPILSVYFMCSPFPWMVKKTNQAMALIDSSVLWFIYIFFFLEIRSFWKRNRKWAAVIFTYLAMGISSAALIQGNMGAAVRHRLLFTALIIPLAAHRIIMIFTKERSVTNEVIWVPRVKGMGISWEPKKWV